MAVRGILLLGLAIILGGCVSPRPPAGSEARTVTFHSGAPQFDAEVAVVRDDAEYGIEVRWGVYPVSLIWTSPRGEIYSILESRISLRDMDSGMVTLGHHERDTIRVADAAAARAYSYEPRSVRLPVEPGSYEVVIHLVDGITAGEQRRSIPVTVPSGDAVSRPGRVSLEAATGEPILSLHVSSGVAGMTAQSRLLGDAPASVTARVRWIESDTTVADPPFYLNRTRGSIRVRGVRIETSEVIREQTWDEVQPYQPVRFDFSLQRGGLYRIEFEANGEVVQRDLVMRQESFPSVNTLGTMSAALSYLASDREMRAIEGATNAAEAKRRVDAFWLDAADHERAAQRLLSTYYGRVEEANRRFSGVKEGWKTDRGMLFIIRGAPLFVERTLDREVWFYSYSPANPAEIYTFERIPLFEFDGQFEQFVLQRGPTYEYEWRRYIDRWRSGRIP
jgi:GWxTD domain-containing protein